MIRHEESELFVRAWRSSTDEEGRKVLDLEIFDSDNIAEGNLKPVVGIYGLRPMDLARVIVAKKAEEATNLRQYVERIAEPEATFFQDDSPNYH